MCLLLVLSFISLAFAQLKDLTPDTFESANRALVAFVAPWCPHCVALKPELARVADKLSDTNIFTINCDQYKQFCESKQVFGFPHIVFKR